MDLTNIKPTLKSGEERFVDGEGELPFRLIDFWRWSVSDLISNATRGILAEFIVTTALNCNMDKPREEWAAFDFLTPEGIKVEVKSSAFLQSWTNGKLSKPSFDIKPTQLLAMDGTILDANYLRRADVYVFCLFKHQEMKSANPLDLTQWEFFVIATKVLNREKVDQKRISLNPLRKLCEKAICYDELAFEVSKCRGL